MKKLLIDVNYQDETNKFYFDSSIKNKVVDFDETENTIHELIQEICSEEGMELSYKGKPQGNIFVDTPNNGAKRVGYIYRGKTEIYDRYMSSPKTGLFDVWVSIKEVIDFDVEPLD